MLPHLGGRRGNPSSLHAFGGLAREGLEEARDSVASLIGASPGEIVFTSGGTESDDLAVLGLARSAGPEKRHAVISCVEHAAVREAARRLESEGFGVSWIGVDADGLVDPEVFAASLRADTALAAVVWANNEVGTIEPVPELAEVCARKGHPFPRRRRPGRRQGPYRRLGDACLDAGPLGAQAIRSSGRRRPVRA